MTFSERLTGVDRSWLRMDSPANPMVVTGFFGFDRRLDLEALRARVQERMLAIPRFRCRVVSHPSGARWEEVEDLDVASLVVEHELPEPVGPDTLRDWVGDEVMRGFPEDAPPWRVTLVRRPQGDLLFFDVHHAIADGIAMTKVLLTLCDAEDEVLKPTGSAGRVGAPVPERVRDEVRSLVRSAGHRDIARALQAARDLLAEGLALLRQRGLVREVIDQATPWAKSFTHLLLTPPDPVTPLRDPVIGAKGAAWTQRWELAAVKHAARQQGATINDLLLAAVAGALHAHLDDRAQPLAPDEGLRALVPVNLRPPDGEVRLGNHFGLLMPQLPVGEVDRLARLHRVRDEMRRIKASVEPIISFAFFEALGHTTDAIQAEVRNFWGPRSSLVLTNLPGPRRQLELLGAPVTDVMAWVPQPGLGLGISLVSYAGGVYLGVLCDLGVVPDPRRLMGQIETELAALGVPPPVPEESLTR